MCEAAVMSGHTYIHTHIHTHAHTHTTTCAHAHRGLTTTTRLIRLAWIGKCSPLKPLAHAQVAKILRAKLSRAQTAHAIFARLINIRAVPKVAKIKLAEIFTRKKRTRKFPDLQYFGCYIIIYKASQTTCNLQHLF